MRLLHDTFGSVVDNISYRLDNMCFPRKFKFQVNVGKLTLQKFLLNYDAFIILIVIINFLITLFRVMF